MRGNHWLRLSFAWVAALALCLSAGLSLAQQPPAKVFQEAVRQHGRMSEFWLGLVSEPLPDALRIHLNLPENQGLLVEQVAPESPAAAAALQRYDILLKADGKTLVQVGDLIAAVDAAKGKKMNLEILRKGKPMKVEVTPAKRPEGEAWRLLPPPGGEPWGEAMRKWAEQLRPGESARDHSLFFLRPGVVVARPGRLPDLPGNVTISITKQGNRPAKIAVTRGNEKWELGEGELDKLPADLRPHVEGMLRHQLQGAFVGKSEGRVLPSPGAGLPPGPRVELRKSVEKQLEEINRRLEETRKAVEELKKHSKK